MGQRSIGSNVAAAIDCLCLPNVVLPINVIEVTLIGIVVTDAWYASTIQRQASMAGGYHNVTDWLNVPAIVDMASVFEVIVDVIDVADVSIAAGIQCKG